MNMIKKLPVALAVVVALCPTSALARKFAQEQIDAVVAKAVDKALTERWAKTDATVAKKTGVINELRSAVQSPSMAIPFGMKFSGYAHYGAHFQSDDQKCIGVDGSCNGTSAIGRLGNEGNGGEFQLSKVFKNDSDAIWDIDVMIDHWGDEVNLKKAYVGVTNVLESNPNAYIWAGRDFHQRPRQGTNDYFWMSHDGQGTGVKNFDIGGVQFSVTTVAAVESCNPEVMEDEVNPSCITCTGGFGTGGKSNYAMASKIHNVKVGPLDLEVYVNYGSDSRAVEGDDRPKAWQSAFVLNHTNNNGMNKVITRYSDNSDSSVYNKTDGPTTVYASFEGSHRFAHQTQVEYLLTFHDYDNSTDKSDNHRDYGAIVHPMYLWDGVHSTWLEAGYQRVDYDNGGDNHGWKLTLSQNMSVAMEPEFHPMLRFYATGGKVDDDRTARVNSTQGETLDDSNPGTMWEAWF